jgi:DHA2 family multidrug resistance protein
MTSILAPIVGPLAGGWLTENLSWHWVFLINLPFGVLVATLVWALFRNRESPRREVPVDAVGLGLLVVGIGALQILLDRGNELDWFGSPLIVGLAVVASIALVVFIAWEWTEAHPIVDLRLFARRNFVVGVTSLMLGTVAFFGTVVMLPLWLQSYQGYTALWAGKMLAFGGVLPVILGPLVGANLNRVDARAVATFGFLSFAVVAFWSARFTPDVDFWTVAATRFLMGLGISCFFLPIITISLSGLPVERIASASGISNFMRILGSSFGIAILTSTWEHRAIVQHARLAESVNVFSPSTTDYLQQLAQLGLQPQAALSEIDRVVTQQSYLMATNAVLCLSGMLMVSLLLLIWWARPPFTIKGPGGH